MNTAGIGQTITIGIHNAVVNGELMVGIETSLTFVPTDTTAADLPNLIPNPDPGDFAAKYGIGTLWQWDGTQWLEV